MEATVTSPGAIWTVVLAQLVAVSLLARLASSTALAKLRDGRDGPQRAQIAHHRNMAMLRCCVLAMFAVDLIVTGWCELIGRFESIRWIPGLSELLILSPFVVGMVLVMLATYPIDRAIRHWVSEAWTMQTGTDPPAWGLWGYLNFNVRHQLLAAFVPMSIILVAYDVTQDYESAITRMIPIPWSSDMVLGVSAAAVFVLAPWLLKRIWTTEPLPQGTLRCALEGTCRRIGLRCRNILIWRSGGMFVNAAVMGLFARVRYVMLSDGLLESMSDKQVEAVFGHEAGHVRHKHIQFFLLFALASMLIASGAMELVYRSSMTPEGVERLSPALIQAMGLGLIVLIWAVGFGFVSRRFERQADLFGAQCVTPARSDDCHLPCSVHRDAEGDAGAVAGGERLCATGARTFVTALDRVAALNGIPLEEPSWRHSSIASRMEHLSALSADPKRVARFERQVRRMKGVLLTVCVVGVSLSAYYVWPWFAAAWTRGAMSTLSR